MTELKITAYKCKKCGRVHYPKHEQCLSCKHREFEEIKPKGHAKLVTYTQIFNLPWGFNERFMIIGIGQFQNGVKAMGQIKADSLDGIKSGMTLDASWEPIRHVFGEPVYGLKFAPVG